MDHTFRIVDDLSDNPDKLENHVISTVCFVNAVSEVNLFVVARCNVS